MQPEYHVFDFSHRCSGSHRPGRFYQLFQSDIFEPDGCLSIQYRQGFYALWHLPYFCRPVYQQTH